METQAGPLDSTKVTRILNGKGSKTRANLVERALCSSIMLNGQLHPNLSSKEDKSRA